LLAELNRNLETNIVTEISEDSELEEDLNIRDEKEVNIYCCTQLIT